MLGLRLIPMPRPRDTPPSPSTEGQRVFFPLLLKVAVVSSYVTKLDWDTLHNFAHIPLTNESNIRAKHCDRSRAGLALLRDGMTRDDHDTLTTMRACRLTPSLSLLHPATARHAYEELHMHCMRPRTDTHVCYDTRLLLPRRAGTN